MDKITCRYEYQEDDTRVLDGSKKIGEKCNNVSACQDENNPAYGYCPSHAYKLGIMPKAVRERRNKRISEGVSKAFKRKFDKKIKRLTKKEKIVEERKKAEALYYMITGDNDFDLNMLVKEHIESYGEKGFRDNKRLRESLFVSWYVADPLSRKPSFAADVAKLLMYTRAALEEWTKSEDFAINIEKYSTHKLKLLVPHVNRQTAIRALNGEDKAIDFFNDQILKNFGGEEGSIVEEIEKFHDEVNDIVGGKGDDGMVFLNESEVEVEDGIMSSTNKEMVKSESGQCRTDK